MIHEDITRWGFYLRDCLNRLNLIWFISLRLLVAHLGNLWFFYIKHSTCATLLVWFFVFFFLQGPLKVHWNCCCIYCLCLSLSPDTEVDECRINPHICGMGICYNTAEGYTCHCDEGYRLDDAKTTCVGKESGARLRPAIISVIQLRIVPWTVWKNRTQGYTFNNCIL